MVEPGGFEPPIRPCEGRVFPLDHGPTHAIARLGQRASGLFNHLRSYQKLGESVKPTAAASLTGGVRTARGQITLSPRRGLMRLVGVFGGVVRRSSMREPSSVGLRVTVRTSSSPETTST